MTKTMKPKVLILTFFLLFGRSYAVETVPKINSRGYIGVKVDINTLAYYLLPETNDTKILIHASIQGKALVFIAKYLDFELDNFETLFSPELRLRTKLNSPESKEYFREKQEINDLLHMYDFTKQELISFYRTCWISRLILLDQRYSNVLFIFTENSKLPTRFQIKYIQNVEVNENNIVNFAVFRTELERINEFIELAVSYKRYSALFW